MTFMLNGHICVEGRDDRKSRTLACSNIYLLQTGHAASCYTAIRGSLTRLSQHNDIVNKFHLGQSLAAPKVLKDPSGQQV